MIVADCLKEREFQIAINRRKVDLEKMLETRHMDVIANELKKYDEKEDLKLAALRKKKEVNKKVLH